MKNIKSCSCLREKKKVSKRKRVQSVSIRVMRVVKEKQLKPEIIEEAIKWARYQK